MSHSDNDDEPPVLEEESNTSQLHDAGTEGKGGGEPIVGSVEELQSQSGLWKLNRQITLLFKTAEIKMLHLTLTQSRNVAKAHRGYHTK